MVLARRELFRLAPWAIYHSQSCHTKPSLKIDPDSRAGYPTASFSCVKHNHKYQHHRKFIHLIRRKPKKFSFPSLSLTVFFIHSSLNVPALRSNKSLMSTTIQPRICIFTVRIASSSISSVAFTVSLRLLAPRIRARRSQGLDEA